MTRSDLIKICTMRIDGYTYQEIADEMGCTKQNIQQTFTDLLSESNSRYYSKSIYPNLIKEIRIKYHKLTDFSKASGIKYARLQGMLTGRVKMSLAEAISIGKILDKDIAYLFERKEINK